MLGLSLVQVCSCKNDAYCEPEDGACVCSPGWLGELCDQQCDKGKYGKNCQYECGCKNGASCDPESGQCKCAPGWQGIFCDKVCPEGKYGADCSKICDCNNGASCHHITGRGQADIVNRVHDSPFQACAPVHLVTLGLPVTGRVQRDTLAVGVSTNATVSTPTLTGATTRQDGVCAGRAGRVSDATRIAPRVGGERAVQRSASVTRAPATN